MSNERTRPASQGIPSLQCNRAPPYQSNLSRLPTEQTGEFGRAINCVSRFKSVWSGVEQFALGCSAGQRTGVFSGRSDLAPARASPIQETDRLRPRQLPLRQAGSIRGHCNRKSTAVEEWSRGGTLPPAGMNTPSTRQLHWIPRATRASRGSLRADPRSANRVAQSWVQTPTGSLEKVVDDLQLDPGALHPLAPDQGQQPLPSRSCQSGSLNR